MSIRDRITTVALGELLNSGGGGKPTRAQLDKYVATSGIGYGGYDQADAHTKDNWCGLFAVYCLKTAGLDFVRWGINGQTNNWGICGNVEVVMGNEGIQVGDVGVALHQSHHFIITSVHPTFVMCIEGNGKPPINQQYLGGIITTTQRYRNLVAWYYRINDYEYEGESPY